MAESARQSKRDGFNAALSPQEEWERAYDEAMQWRDWQTCEILIDERGQADWYVPEEVEVEAFADFRPVEKLTLRAKVRSILRG